MKPVRIALLIGGLAALVLIAAGCGGDGETTVTVTASAPGDEPGNVDRGTVIDVELGEQSGARYFVKPAQATVEAGTVTFAVTNVGELYHEFIVYSNVDEIAAGDLPIDEEANEAVLAEDDILGEAPYATPPIVPADKEPGDADHRIRPEWGAELTVDLEPGKYILLCNIEGHYANRQYAELTAE